METSLAALLLKSACKFPSFHIFTFTAQDFFLLFYVKGKVSNYIWSTMNRTSAS